MLTYLEKPIFIIVNLFSSDGSLFFHISGGRPYFLKWVGERLWSFKANILPITYILPGNGYLFQFSQKENLDK